MRVTWKLLLWILVPAEMLLGGGLLNEIVNASPGHQVPAKLAAYTAFVVVIGAVTWWAEVHAHAHAYHADELIHRFEALYMLLVWAALLGWAAVALGLGNSALIHLGPGQSRAAAFGPPLAGAVLSAGFTAAARRCGRYLRTTLGKPRPRRAPRQVTGSKTRGDVAGVIFAVVIFAVVLAWCAAAADASLRSYQRTEATQYSGLRAQGAVTAVITVSHQTRDGSYDTYDYDVQLATPVLGEARTTVITSLPRAVLAPGSAVTLLIDRGQPGYAELPGRPVNDTGDFLGLAAVTVFLAMFEAGLIEALAKEIRHRRPGRER